MVPSVFRKEEIGKRIGPAPIHWMDAALYPPANDCLAHELQDGVSSVMMGDGGLLTHASMGEVHLTHQDGIRSATYSDISYNTEVEFIRKQVTTENLAHVLESIGRKTYFSWIFRARLNRYFLSSRKRSAQERNLYRRLRRDGYSIKFNLVRKLIGSFEINLDESHNRLLAELWG